MTSKQKTSSVWPFFREDVGTPFATCILCSFRVKRGKEGDRKAWSSKPLWTHLRSRHRTEFQNASDSREKAEQAAKKRKLAEAEKAEVYVNGTPKLTAFLDKKEKYKPDNPQQQKLNKLLTTWISDGVLPYELIDNNRYTFVLPQHFVNSAGKRDRLCICFVSLQSVCLQLNSSCSVLSVCCYR